MNRKLKHQFSCLLIAMAFFSFTTMAQRQLQDHRGQTVSLNKKSTDKQDPLASEDISPLEAFRSKKEDFSKRDAYSKHFLNEDGSYTALIGSGPIHYEKNGQFQDIDHNITRSGNATFPFANTTNIFESYFGETSHTGVKNKTAEGEVVEFLNTKMYWEVDGRAINESRSSNVAVSIDGDKAYYHNLYGNISAEFITLTGKRKLNYIIPNRQALGNHPSNAEYLVFAEEIVLPVGWTSKAGESGIFISDASGKQIYQYENPVSTDASHELSREQNTIFETVLNDNILTVLTKVKTAWLLSQERHFPVKVDPTVNVYPNTVRNWTGYVWSDGVYRNNDVAAGYAYAPYWVAGSLRFNLLSIPNNSTVSSATGYINVLGGYGAGIANKTWALVNSMDPIGVPDGVSSQGTNLYNSMTTALSQTTGVTGLGWRSSLFAPAGRTYIQNAINNDFVAMGLYAMGTYNNGQYFEVAGYSSDNRPYLSINYTPPAPCSGTPAGGSTVLTPNTGTFGSTFNATVTGSTSASGINYQWQSASLIDGPWTNVSGATLATASFTAPYEIGTIYYRRMITCTNSGLSSYSTAAEFTATCTPSHTEGNVPGGGYGYIGITNVTIGSINNTTGYQNPAPAFNYYSGQSSHVELGQNYSLKVTYKDDGTPFNPGKIGVWVDWNEDGDFNDADEFIGISPNSTSGNQVINFTISVPNNATPGTKRLRIRSAFFDEVFGANDACSILEYGETEDYNLNLVIPEPDFDFTYINDTDQWTPNYPGDTANPSTATSTILVAEGTAVFNTDIIAGTLTVNENANLQVEHILKLHGDIINDGLITFKSTSIENTAQFDAFHGTITGNGEVTVERFIPARRSFRFLSPAVNSTGSIRENWQEDGRNETGLGIHITGTDPVVNGFDPTLTNNPSMFTLETIGGVQSWESIQNTHSKYLFAGDPYLVMVRGDRNTDLNNNNATPSETVLRTTGKLVTGDKEVQGSPMEEDNYFFFGNPYQAAVDIEQVMNNASGIGLEFFYLWVPSLGGADGVGAYVTYDMDLGEGDVESDVTPYLQPGQAIMVKSTSDGVPEVLFKEEFKRVDQPLTHTYNIVSKLAVQMYSTDAYDNNQTPTDGIIVKFSENGNNAVNHLDASKMFNFTENLALSNNDNLLSIESRAYPENGEVFPLYTSGYASPSYVFEARVTMVPENTKFYIYDNHTHTSTEISETGRTTYRFDIDRNNSESTRTDRFEIRTVVNNLGMADHSLASIAMFPNPFDSQGFDISAMDLEGQTLDVQIVNMLGQTVYNEKLLVKNGKATVSLIYTIASGIYTVNITAESGQTINKKMVRK